MRRPADVTLLPNDDPFLRMLKTSLDCDNPYARDLIPEHPVLLLEMPAYSDMDENYATGAGHIRTSGSQLNIGLPSGMDELMYLRGDDVFQEDDLLGDNASLNGAGFDVPGQDASRKTKWKRVSTTQPGWVVPGFPTIPEENTFSRARITPSVALGNPFEVTVAVAGQELLDMGWSLTGSLGDSAGTEAPKRKTRRAGAQARARRARQQAAKEAEEALRRQNGEDAVDSQKTSPAAHEADDSPTGIPMVKLPVNTDIPVIQIQKKPRGRSSQQRVARKLAGDRERAEIAAQRAAELNAAQDYFTTFADIPGNVTFILSGPWHIPTATAEVLAPIYPGYTARDFPDVPLAAKIPRLRHRLQYRTHSDSLAVEGLTDRDMTSITRSWDRISSEFRSNCTLLEQELERADAERGSITQGRRAKQSLFPWVNDAFVAIGYPNLSPPCRPEPMSSNTPSTPVGVPSTTTDLPTTDLLGKQALDPPAAAACERDSDISIPAIVGATNSATNSNAEGTDSANHATATASVPTAYTPARRIKIPRLLLATLGPSGTSANMRHTPACSPLGQPPQVAVQ